MIKKLSMLMAAAFLLSTMPAMAQETGAGGTPSPAGAAPEAPPAGEKTCDKNGATTTKKKTHKKAKHKKHKKMDEKEMGEMDGGMMK